MTLSLSLSRKKMTTRQKRKRKGGSAASSAGWENADSGSKGGKLFYLRLACRRCTLFSLENALSRSWGDEGNSSAVPVFRALVFNLSLSLSLNSLLLRFKPRPFFFEHGFSSSTRGKNRSRERIFHGEIFVAPRSFPHDYATRQLFCSLQYNFESRAKLFPMIQREREREREQASAKVGQGSTYLFDSVPFFNGR